ncbi:MAG: hypothetical protein V1901_03850 [Patescibacteria group bacterium]
MPIKSDEVLNSMRTLSFYWKCILNDDSEIYQFDGKIEHRFQEVIDNFDNLKYFILYHKEKDINFILDLKKGIILRNLKFNKEIDYDLIEEKFNIRPIFNRRHTIKKIVKGNETHEIIYIFGCQYLDKENRNHKVIFHIDSEGNFTMGSI